MTDLSELIARIEAASGPDRELDFWISVRVEGTRYTDAELQADIDLVGIEGMHIPFAYTASIDAALTLVPEGYFPTIDFVACRCWIRDAQGFDMPHGCAYGCGATPALALCAAALRARMNP